MTIMSLLLLIILFLAGFIYFSGLNPQDVTIYYYPGESITHSMAVVVVGCLLAGLVLGYLAHLYSTLNHILKHWRRDQAEKKNREVSAIYRDGVNRLLSGDIKKARGLLTKALDRDPARVDTNIALANVFLQDGEPQEAINLLTKARSIDPKSLEVLFKLAATYEETGRQDEAMRAYESILALEENNRKALRGLRDLNMAVGKWPKALEQQKQILKLAAGGKRLDEEKQVLLYLRYEVARQALEGNQADAAKSEFKDILKLSPEFVPARVSLGDAYKALGRSQDAVKVWQLAYRELGKSVFLSRLEDLFMEAEDPATLLSYYRNAVVQKGDDLMLRFFFGKFCLRLEMVDEAMEQLAIVESAGVESAQLHLLLAEGHRRRRRVDDSIEEYKKALGVNNRLRFGYVCDHCGQNVPEWQSRCPSCGTWGNFSLAGRKALRSAQLLELREIHHGEREAWHQE